MRTCRDRSSILSLLTSRCRMLALRAYTSTSTMHAITSLVLNYDRNQVYMPYINYEGSKLDIDASDYTFEYTDNGDGTYTYNARFVTLDGRIIEFAGALPTTVS